MAATAAELVSVPWSGFINRKEGNGIITRVEAGSFQSRGRDLLIGKLVNGWHYSPAAEFQSRGRDLLIGKLCISPNVTT